ncbi:MAG: DUF2200 family protein [Gemmatimonadaceae bacterium]
METHRIFKTSFASVYPHYVQKAEKKGRTKQEVDEVIWLADFGLQPSSARQADRGQKGLRCILQGRSSAPSEREQDHYVICGVRIEEIEHPLMQKIRYMDKLIDELAKGRPMAKILRT